jgi:hypothetical protein
MLSIKRSTGLPAQGARILCKSATLVLDCSLAKLGATTPSPLLTGAQQVIRLRPCVIRTESKFSRLAIFWTQVDLCALLAGRGLLLRQFFRLRTSFRVIFPGWLVQDGT